MMYILSKKIEVLSFRVSSNELSYADKSKNLTFRNQIITTNTSSNGYFLDGRYFFYGNETDYKTRFIDFKTNKTTEILGYIGSPSEQLFDGEIFVTHEYLDLVEFKQQLISYNIKTNEKKVIKANVGAVLLHNKNVITREGAIILRSLSLLTGEYEWELDLGVQGLEVGGILGVEGANLIVLCENKQHQQVLLSLDVATGREVWRRDLQVSHGGTYAFNEDKTSIFYMHAGGLWLNGVRVAQGSNIFREIDTADGSVRREGVLWQMDGAGLGIKNCTFQDGFIYFTAVYQSFGPTVIGVLDYETLSLLWWEEVQMQEADGFGNFFLNQPLQVSENRIYVLDKTHVLHIYERDGSIPFVKPAGSGLAGFEVII